VLKFLFRKIFGKYNFYNLTRNTLNRRFPKHFYFRSYSQWGEDAVLSQFLHEDKGSYIDIGSGHPIVGNNTFFLYLRGWKGVLIDPIQKNIELSRRYRKRDNCVHKIVTNNPKNLNFWEFNNYGLSTVDSNRAQMLQKQGHVLKNYYEVEPISLENLIDRFFSKNEDLPLLLSIDVEGHELEVLKSNNWGKFHPRTICIEILMDDLTKITPIHIYLFNLGYVLKASVGNSHIFIEN